MKDKKQVQVPTLEALQTELEREKYKMRFRRILRSTVNALIVVAAIAAIVATLILPVLEIAGTSMEPSLNDGDIVLLMKTDKPGQGRRTGKEQILPKAFLWELIP